MNNIKNVETEIIVKIIFNIFKKYHKYISKNSYYEISMSYQEPYLEDVYDVIDDDIPIEVICLKLVHNMSMINNFANHMIYTTNARISNGGKRQNMFIELEVGSENIRIVKRKGFGLLTYNVDDMSRILFDTNKAIIDYLKELISESNEYKNFKMIVDESFAYSNSSVNDAMIRLIFTNMDIYKKYI